eukprot:PhF_6_TR41330/c1_g2_i1/m.62656
MLHEQTSVSPAPAQGRTSSPVVSAGSFSPEAHSVASLSSSPAPLMMSAYTRKVSPRSSTNTSPSLNAVSHLMAPTIVPTAALMESSHHVPLSLHHLNNNNNTEPQHPHFNNISPTHSASSIMTTTTTRDVTCDKCKQIVKGGDFRVHNKFCLGKLCNRCREVVHGSYDDHKAVCSSRKCDRCGIIPTVSFTEHNKLCKQQQTPNTNNNTEMDKQSPPPTSAVVAALPTMKEATTTTRATTITFCKLCGGNTATSLEGVKHENICGRVCPVCLDSYVTGWDDHVSTCTGGL